MNDDVMIDDGCGWALAGVLCDLEGAVLTAAVGDGGLAGTLDVGGALAAPANDARYERFEEEAR